MKSFLKISLLAGIAQTVLSAQGMAMENKDFQTPSLTNTTTATATQTNKNLSKKQVVAPTTAPVATVAPAKHTIDGNIGLSATATVTSVAPENLTITGNILPQLQKLSLKKMLKLEEGAPPPNIAAAIVPVTAIVTPITSTTATSTDNATQPMTTDTLASVHALTGPAVLKTIIDLFESAGFKPDFPAFIAQTYALPTDLTAIQVNPFSTAPHPYLNDAQTLMMEDFLSITTDEAKKLERLSKIIAIFGDVSKESDSKISSLAAQISSETIESVQGNLRVLKNSIETSKTQNLLYCKEMLYHFAIGYDYITGALDAIKSNMTLIETVQSNNSKDPQTISTNKNTITKAQDSIDFCKQSIWEMETLMHALYPYHRSEGAVEYVGNILTSWVKRVVSPAYSEASQRRLDLTGHASLAAMNLSSPPIGFGAPFPATYHNADLHIKYETSLKYMFAQSRALTEAIEGKRLTFVMLAPVKTATPAVVTNDTTAAVTTATAATTTTTAVQTSDAK